MMAARHKKSGGKVSGGAHGPVYAGGGSNVIAEAKKKNRGGSVGSVPGYKSGGRLDKRARGGRIGGGGDCTKSPFSAAHVKTSGDA